MNIAAIRCSMVLAFAALLASCCSSGSNGSDGLVRWLFGCTAQNGTSNGSSGLWQGAQLIGGNGASDATNPQIAEDTSGNALAVWQQSDGVQENIWGNLYTAGSGWGTAVVIESNNSGDATNPQIAIDSAGDALAVWQQSDGVRDNIWANRYAAGSGWGTAAVIESNNAGDATNPQIAIDSAGDALVVWQQSDGVRDNIWANRYAAGSGWGTAELIETNNAGDATNPQIAVDSAGDALAVWQQSDGVRDNIWANRFTPSGGWDTARLIESNNSGDATNPQIAVDSAGDALAVWQQSNGVLDSIWANHYAASGGWSTARLVESNNTGDATNPQIAIDSTGNALAVWQQSDGTRNNIWANRFTPASDWGTARLIESDNSGDATNPQIAVDSAGDALAVWQQFNGTHNTIFANSYTTGGGWNNAELIGASNTGDAILPHIAIDGDGKGLAVWYQLNGAKYSIASNLFE